LKLKHFAHGGTIEINKCMLKARKYLYIPILFFVFVCAVLIINLDFIINRAVYFIYSNDFHTVPCDRQPANKELSQKFNTSKSKLLDRIKQIEKESSLTVLEDSYFIEESQVNGSYISILLNKTCEGDKAELQVFITSNDFIPKLKQVIYEEFGDVPVSYINN
jgi:hypothetical protein